jgi:hypothetical protein
MSNNNRASKITKRAAHFKTFVKYWRVGSNNNNNYYYLCLDCPQVGCLRDCNSEITFYDWLRTTRGTQAIARHVPKVFGTSRNTLRLPSATFYYNSNNGAVGSTKPTTARYAYLQMEYLDGFTLRSLYNQSSNCYEAGMYARSCFQQLLPIFQELNKFGFKYTDFNAGQYMLVGKKWYLIDMNIDYDERVKHNPQFTDWKQLVQIYMNFADDMVAKGFWNVRTANAFSNRQIHSDCIF